MTVKVNSTNHKFQNVWQNIPRPFFVLAPMANVTNSAFRQIIKRYSNPDLMVTEFVSCEGLCSAGRERLLLDLKFDKSERPILAQFFGNRPETFFECAKLARELGFDGIDINTGCPDRKVLKQGAGAALIKSPKLMSEIVKATKEGAQNLPVSIKTRLGVEKDNLNEWIEVLLATQPAAITLHARTVREMSNVPAHWDAVERAVNIASGTGVLIVGNGDVRNIKHGVELSKLTGADGIMIGRAIYGNPWLFNSASIKQKIRFETALNVMLEHALLFDQLHGNHRNFLEMRRHFKSYVAGYPESKKLKLELMETHTYEEAKEIVTKYLNLI